MKEWLSIVEYARHYQVSDMTVRRRIKTGRLQAVLKEGKYFIPAGRGQEFIPPPAPQPQSPRHPEFLPMVAAASPAQEISTAKTREWFMLCREILDKLSEKEIWMEKHLALSEQAHQTQIALLQEEARSRETKIDQLGQQIEDLQLFVQLLDEKKSSPR